MEHRILRIVFILATCVTALVLLVEGIPLGVPGEWTWARAELGPQTAVAMLIAALAGTAWLGFVWLGARRMEAAGRLERAGWLTALAAAACGWLTVALDVAPPPLGYSRVPWVLYYPRSSGYFWQARYDVEDSAVFLAGYEQLLAQRDYLHIGTHPPGLTLGYRGLWRLCRAFPALTDAVLATQPHDVGEAVATIREAPLANVPAIDRADEACLWLAGLVTQLAAVLTAIGIYHLAVRQHDRTAAWMAACLWPLVPAIAVFFPKSDVLYALPAVAVAWLWLSACDRQSLLRAAAAGLVLWIGMLLSLAFVTVAALIGVMTVWEACTRRRLEIPDRARFVTAKLALGATAGFAVPLLAAGVFAHVNLVNVWSWNLSNHALFYEHNVRTWWAWLLVNPLELAFAVGLPVACLAAVAVARLVRSGEWRTPRASAAVACVTVWGLLWLSGKNMGEAARLWILIMPWVILTAASALEGLPGGRRQMPRSALWLFAAQLIAALVTMMRVDGFHFAELLSV